MILFIICSLKVSSEISREEERVQMDNNKVALRSGYYFMLFDKNDIPFFNELEKTNRVILMDNQEYHLYESPTWEIAQKVDALMGDDELGFSIDDYELNKKINV